MQQYMEIDMKFLSTVLNFIRDTFNEIEINVEITPSDSLSAEIQLEVEAGEYLYSYRWDRWFHTSEITPLATSWDRSDDYEAALTSDGFILFAFECVWQDGVTVSDVEIPSEKPAPVSVLRQILDAPKKNGLVYEVGF